MGGSDLQSFRPWQTDGRSANYLAHHCPSEGDIGKLERLHLFRVDSRYLLRTVARELRKHDALKCGVIPAAKFSDVLEELGLRFGSPEIDLLLRFCTVTPDGYVHYKHLLLDIDPYKDSHSADSVEEALRPPNVVKRDVFETTGRSEPPSSDHHHVLTPEKSDQIRRLFCMWDKNAVRDAEFVAELRGLGVPTTPEFERLLVTYGPSRTMSFSQFMRALHMNEYAWRKARVPVPDPETVPGLRCCGFRNSPNLMKRNRITWSETFYDPKRNPITWTEAPPSPDSEGVPSSTIMSEEEFRREAEKTDVFALLQKLASDFLDSNQPSSHFRSRLRRLGVAITPELDALIRSHDCDNRGNFKDLMRELYRGAFEQKKPLPAQCVDQATVSPLNTRGGSSCGTPELPARRNRFQGHGDIISWRQPEGTEGNNVAPESRVSRRALCGAPQASNVVSWRITGEPRDDALSRPLARGRGGNRGITSSFQGSVMLLPEESGIGELPGYNGKRQFTPLAAQCPFGTELNS